MTKTNIVKVNENKNIITIVNFTSKKIKKLQKELKILAVPPITKENLCYLARHDEKIGAGSWIITFEEKD